MHLAMSSGSLGLHKLFLAFEKSIFISLIDVATIGRSTAIYSITLYGKQYLEKELSKFGSRATSDAFNALTTSHLLGSSLIIILGLLIFRSFCTKPLRR